MPTCNDSPDKPRRPLAPEIIVRVEESLNRRYCQEQLAKAGVQVLQKATREADKTK